MVQRAKAAALGGGRQLSKVHLERALIASIGRPHVATTPLQELAHAVEHVSLAAKRSNPPSLRLSRSLRRLGPACANHLADRTCQSDFRSGGVGITSQPLCRRRCASRPSAELVLNTT